MTELFETDDVHDRRLRARGSRGCWRAFNDAGLLEAADVHVAQPAVLDLVGETDEAVRARRRRWPCAPSAHGSVCVDLDRAGRGRSTRTLPWPAARRLARRVAASAARRAASLRPGRATRCSTSTATGARRARSRDDLLAAGRPSQPPPVDRRPRSRPALDRIFPRGGYDEQRAAARGRRDASGPRCSPAGPAPARPPRSPGCWRCWPSRPSSRRRRRPAAGRADRPDRQGRGPAAGGGRHGPPTALPPADRDARRGPVRLRPCTGCWAGAPTRAPGSATTAATGCRTTSSSSTRRRWCR